ncbi:MAG: hypothetical protein Q9200_001190 [Gallowayella weberi]
MLTCTVDEEEPGNSTEAYEVRIHEHGDLSSPNMSTANPVLHSCLVKDGNPQLAMYNATRTAFMDSRLELSVSEHGIIGRMVSIVRGQQRIGEGVVGWN